MRGIEHSVRKIYRDKLQAIRSYHPANAQCFDDEAFFQWLQRAQGGGGDGPWHGGLGSIPDIGVLRPGQTLWRFTPPHGRLSNWFISGATLNRIRMQASARASEEAPGRRLKAVQVAIRELLQLPPKSDGDPTLIMAFRSSQNVGVIVGGTLSWQHDDPINQGMFRYLQSVTERRAERPQEMQIYVPDERERLSDYLDRFGPMQPISQWVDS